MAHKLPIEVYSVVTDLIRQSLALVSRVKMYGKKVEQKTDGNWQQKRNFVWSFKFPLIWMRLLLGVELNSQLFTMNTRGCRICYLVGIFSFGFVLLVTSIGANTFSLIDLINSVVDPPPELLMLSQANLFIIAITGINDTIFNVVIHLIFFSFVVLSRKWKSLWSVLLKIQFQSPEFDCGFYVRCRKFALAGMILIFVNFGMNLYLAVSNIQPTSLMISSIVAIGRISGMMSLSIIVWFCILIWTAIHMFQFLNLKIIDLQQRVTSSQSKLDDVSKQLEDWRRLHTLVCEFVCKIKSFFGIILLVFISHGFVSFITDTFEITLAFKSSNSLQTRFIMRFCQQIVLMTLVCYGCFRLQSEASKALGHLRKLNFSSVSPLLQLQLNGVMLEVDQTQIIISAAEFFDVNLTIFPVLVGTTLTYLIILYQQVSIIT